jgi:hypothetical protein
VTISWQEVYQGTPYACAQMMKRDTTFDAAIRAALIDIDPAIVQRDAVSEWMQVFLTNAIAIRDGVGGP